MDYTNSPACELVASSCACCGRPLVDAVSVEAGVGPECREKHGFDEPQGAPNWAAFGEALSDLNSTAFVNEAFAVAVAALDARKVANMLVYRIAAEQSGADVNAYTNAIAWLGFSKLAERIAKRVAAVKITETADGFIAVRGPYSERAIVELRRVPGRVWDKAAKVNRFPVESRGHLWAALRRAYPGATATGPKGVFVIVAA